MRQASTFAASLILLATTGCVGTGAPNATLAVTAVPLPKSQGTPADGYYGDAAQAIMRRDYGKALEMLQLARGKAPNDVRVINAFGVVYDKLGRFDLSARYYAQAAALAPDSEIVRQNRAYSELLQNGGVELRATAPVSLAAAEPAIEAAPRPVVADLRAAPTVVAFTREEEPLAAPLAVLASLVAPVVDVFKVPAPVVAARKPAPAPVLASAAALPRFEAAPIPAVAPVPAAILASRVAPVVDAVKAPTPVVAARKPSPVLGSAAALPRFEPAPPAVILASLVAPVVDVFKAPAPVAAARKPAPAFTVTSLFTLPTLTAAPAPAEVARAAPAPPVVRVNTAPKPVPAAPRVVAAVEPAPRMMPGRGFAPPPARVAPAPARAVPTSVPARPAPVQFAKAAPPRAKSVPAVAVAKKPAASSPYWTRNPPLVVVNASGRANHHETLRAALARRGWSAPVWALRQTKVQTASVIRYPEGRQQSARALAATLPGRAELRACGGACAGLELVIGKDALRWDPTGRWMRASRQS